jgi:hypothetical protein
VKAEDPLWVARVVLCDVLVGRWFRTQAAALIERAVLLEHQAKEEQWPGGWRTVIDADVNQAAGLERMAELAEQGKILWGKRYSRRGERPEDDG